MAKYEYVEFDKDAIYDFRDVILPNVWDELFTADSFEEINAYAIGALKDNTPVGSVIFHQLPNEEMFISSIFVSENERRNGIGSELISNLLSVSVSEFDLAPENEDSIVTFFVHTEYALPKDEQVVFEAFLKNVGFNDFAEREPVFLFDSNDLTYLLNEKTDDVSCLYDALEEDNEDVNEILRYMGMNIDVDNCFFIGNKENPKYLLFAEYADDNDFIITSRSFDENITKEDVKKVVSSLVKKLSNEEGFTLIVSGEKNDAVEFWNELSEHSGEKVSRFEAGMYAYAD